MFCWGPLLHAIPLSPLVCGHLSTVYLIKAQNAQKIHKIHKLVWKDFSFALLKAMRNMLERENAVQVLDSFFYIHLSFPSIVTSWIHFLLAAKDRHEKKSLGTAAVYIIGSFCRLEAEISCCTSDSYWLVRMPVQRGVETLRWITPSLFTGGEKKRSWQVRIALKYQTQSHLIVRCS